jgi:hypothetical protein
MRVIIPFKQKRKEREKNSQRRKIAIKGPIVLTLIESDMVRCTATPQSGNHAILSQIW